MMIPTIPTPEEILDKGFSRGKKAADLMRSQKIPKHLKGKKIIFDGVEYDKSFLKINTQPNSSITFLKGNNILDNRNIIEKLVKHE